MTQNTTTSSPILLEAKNLAKHYPVSQGWLKPKALARALDGVSFALTPGKTLAVVGESGCGKSTLARQITMIEAPTSGELWMDGINIAHADRRTLKRVRPLVQMVFQNPYASLNPRKKVSAMLEEPLTINTSLSQAERADKARAMMAKVGLRPEHYGRFPHMFSGGQRQRIAIARALMLDPKVIVADEPVSALDVSIQAQVLNLLMDLQESSGVAYLFISHNLSVVEHIADEVLVMYLGKCVEQGSKVDIFSRPLHPYTKALLASTPRIDPSQRQQKMMLPGELPSPLAPPPGCAFSNRCPHANDHCRQDIPALRRFEGRLVACHRLEEIS
ncbi:peptide ABC transporter ATP-binding protein [Undibacterium sp.]|jgi:dipeptide transport system ATP-binding protein|uniref:peptide ABC transporter ATP-binding protein n=1 Tax=Undibacterium sp. TaxID=1914977 RepID=UPI002C238004|nr:peptide ABC transporter ATP-binding protein [Undibacterium sp.]HTD03301.1 peptide ABC transporter ATP-binding protein [Undibacterium sp.]